MTESRRAPRVSRILIVDDQHDVLEALRLLLKGEPFAVETAGSPAAALARLSASGFDAVLIDLNYTRDTTSGREGLELLRAVRELEPELPVIVMTAWGTVDVAVEAMREGASDFIEKPWDNQRLLSVLRNQVELGRALRATRRLQAENDLLHADGGDFIAESVAMQPVLQLVGRVAASDANILITGEAGTGKGELARLVHARSKRASQAFIDVNMGGIADSIFESEMFGHVRGAFTDAKADRIGRFELADGGTLFLDEVACLPLNQQGKLLRVLESGDYEPVGSSRTRHADVRVISATNGDLRAMIAAGEFRADLLFRLNTLEIESPPLRERREDIMPLATRFLEIYARKYGRETGRFARDAVQALLAYAWPGNLRELSHVIERALLIGDDPQVQAADLMLVRRTDSGRASLEQLTLDEAEQLMIRSALNRCRGNVQLAAEQLGLSRSAMYRRMEKHGFRNPADPVNLP
ncbi:MAG TPA: sigma-54 dependent transcriptional regulator [Gammaproteobacteria bacterium]|nr:sigma-54 dependent transcriptional regulator [Gammaproteobacteria bacterium]